ncbi:adenylyl cyclase-associated protein 1-like, partial [Stegodyphus dumicola]|uniref:adenylyl cyclase-associated protein 1-like n=1 Tax=Stegodyphus dumicola TaxID=202533 RepID=UPI0015AF42F5
TCKKTNIALNDVISSVELIRCERVQVQCNGHVPLMSIDNSDSVQVFLPKEARGIEIISSKSSSCNVCLLEPDGTYTEFPVPEQIKTVVVGGQITSTVVENN